MIIVVELGEGEGGCPWLLDFDAGFDMVHGVDVFLEGVDLNGNRKTLYLECR